ncbi:S-DNA-T family DNA segregation ATPase FtsK/SpoIIIE [Halopolyspora algeriensis]|uniref:S-DNA-T family DNA segregation ATPase FtsK/SpoIIIE n=2 Tax=Halopolyspora algeriensis TaxID=1500506 RepID=A0A368VX05_9ACTN|nr:type VII secretion protein EccCa [Halopolyspora algeriensis]RCW46738.1 S-DNA-T family DNA segregation ATPase FtsK/SpoIIIE [Halopolyspora algeriensis]
MSTLQFKRTPRMAAPKPPGGEVHLEPPPEIPRAVPGNIVQKFLPVVMIIASLGMMVFMLQRAKDNPMMLMMPMMMLVSTVGMMAGGNQGGGQSKAEMNEDRKDYLRYLGQMRERAREAADEQRLARIWVHPEPQTLWSIATSRRMWERRAGDADFCQVRVGIGSQRLETRLVPPQTGPVDELEPITTLALRRFVRAHSLVAGLPVATSLRGFAAVGLQGERELCRSLVRAMLAQLATFHTPDDVLIAVASGGRSRLTWDWVKWLPHAQHPTATDGIGRQRLMAGSLRAVEEMLAEQLGERPRFSRNNPAPDGPHIVIVLDDAEISREEQILMEGGLAGVTLIDLSDVLGPLTTRRGVRMVVEEERIGARSANSVEWFGTPDSMTEEEVTALARQLAPYRLAGGGQAEADSGGQEPLTTHLNYVEQLGLSGDPMTFDLNEAWRPRSIPERYSVAIGPGEYGDIVSLDIKETASGGMGPHGLCIGATGSGKSEFLRTIVLGLLATHSSTALNFVLVDFKGGATFNGFEKAPHVSATITNLADDLTQVDRMQDALAGEMNRRQEELNKAGAKNVWDYEEKRQAGEDLAPLPALFIVVDEFSELLSTKPDFAELFAMIGRLGRSLQVHLLLASQRLEEGKLRGLDAHLSYRIGLKTFNAAESRAAIGVPDAADLPATGGHGYLKHPNGMERFRAAYVSGHLHQGTGRRRTVAASPVTGVKRPRFFVPDYIEVPREPEQPAAAEPAAEPEPPGEDKQAPTDFQIIIDKAQGQGPPAHQVWLPPLDAPPTLDTLLPPLSATDDRGYTSAGYAGSGRLQIPVGIIDMPYQQRQDHMVVDLGGASGHGAVVGGPQSGKSNLFRTLITSMALTHTPQEVQFYCIDLGGGSMAALQTLPHVGGFGGRRDPDTVRRTVAELKALLAEREARFQEMSLDSMADFRTRKRRGEIADDPYGDVFLIVDGWGAFRNEFESLEQDVLNLAAQGLTFGIHVFVSANRWAEIRPALKDLLGTRFELRLGDAGESEIDRKVAVNVPAGRPGRGLHPSKMHFLTALPRVDSENLADREGWEAYNEDLSGGVSDLVNRVRSSWKGRPAPQVRLLPDMLPYEQLPSVEQQPKPKLVPIGINEDGLQPMYLDFVAEPHFHAFGERESGKTALLRTIVRGITERYTPQEALILLVDYRRTMLGFLDTKHLLEYSVSADQLKSNVGEVTNALKKRLPGPDVTQEQLRNRSWWSGPELFVIVDDYELVAPQGNNPLAPLADYIPQAGDVGLHIVLARNSGGANRALFEPVIGKMRESSAPGLAMSANKDDGQLVGNVKSRPLSPGRGTLVSRSLRGGPQLVQTAFIRPE